MSEFSIPTITVMLNLVHWLVGTFHSDNTQGIAPTSIEGGYISEGKARLVRNALYRNRAPFYKMIYKVIDEKGESEVSFEEFEFFLEEALKPF